MRFNDMDDFYIRAEEELTEELEREPSLTEIAKRAEELFSDYACKAYDSYKDSKYE